MSELFLCAQFENSSLQSLKNFFTHFKRANPKAKLVYFQITQADMTLFYKDQIQSCYLMNNTSVIQQLKMGNELCNNKYIILQFQDFDDVIVAVNKIIANPKDVRIYLEQIEDQLYLTVKHNSIQWNVTQQDETCILKQTLIEFVEELNINLLELQPMIIMPTQILSQMATIAKNYDCAMRLNFYKQDGQYSVEIQVKTETSNPSFSSLFLASQHIAGELKQYESFFEINKNYIQQFIDLTSIEEEIVISLDSTPTSPLVLNYYQGQDVELGAVKQFIIPRMYS